MGVVLLLSKPEFQTQIKKQNREVVLSAEESGMNQKTSAWIFQINYMASLQF